ncbi:putative BAI1-associated protein 3-like, partial [Homarus americanus]
MFKIYGFSLKKPWKPTAPSSVATGNQTEVRSSTSVRNSGLVEGSAEGRDVADVAGISDDVQEEKEEEEGVRRNRLERRSEEHGRLVAAQVFLSWPQEGSRRAYQSSLTTALDHHHLSTTTQGGGDDRSRLWNGHLSSKATEDLHHLGTKLRLSQEVQQLAWWVVGSRLASVDALWTYNQLQVVQKALADGAYGQEDLDELLHSLTLYIYSQIKRLKSLHSAFPGTQAGRQLTYTLRSLQGLEQHPATRQLLDQAGQPVLPEDILAAILRHAHDWWAGVLQVIQKEEATEENPHQQVPALVEVTHMALTFLQQDAQHYDHIFNKEMGVTYTSISYGEFSKQVAQVLRPLLRPSPPRYPTRGELDGEQHRSKFVHNFDVGSSLWSLYHNLRHMHAVGVQAGGGRGEDEGRGGGRRGRETGGEGAPVESFPSWFMDSVATWLTHSQQENQRLLQEALLQDSLSVVTITPADSNTQTTSMLSNDALLQDE